MIVFKKMKDSLDKTDIDKKKHRYRLCGHYYNTN